METADRAGAAARVGVEGWGPDLSPSRAAGQAAVPVAVVPASSPRPGCVADQREWDAVDPEEERLDPEAVVAD
ncbi:MAG: hypothetical protein M3063_13285, partial [Actinomycetota bacterium]|nr:hypothetical protein [Actinomycetota bacterium]